MTYVHRSDHEAEEHGPYVPQALHGPRNISSHTVLISFSLPAPVFLLHSYFSFGLLCPSAPALAHDSWLLCLHGCAASAPWSRRLCLLLSNHPPRRSARALLLVALPLPCAAHGRFALTRSVPSSDQGLLRRVRSVPSSNFVCWR
jgi:hypothetical protein